MDTVKEGDKVQLICEGKLEDGRTFFKNNKKNPLVFTVGEGKFFPVVENKLKDIKQGETKTVTLEPSEGFGIHNDELVVEISKKDLNIEDKLDIGSYIKIKTDPEKTITGTVKKIDDDKIIVDFNHPLVDKKIIFSLTVNSIEKS